MSSSRSPSWPHRFSNDAQGPSTAVYPQTTQKEEGPEKVQSSEEREAEGTIESPISDPPYTPQEPAKERNTSESETRQAEVDAGPSSPRRDRSSSLEEEDESDEEGDEDIVKAEEDEREESLRRRLARGSTQERSTSHVNEEEEEESPRRATSRRSSHRSTPGMASSRRSRSSQPRQSVSSEDAQYVEDNESDIQEEEEEEKHSHGRRSTSRHPDEDVKMEEIKEEQVDTEMRSSPSPSSPSPPPSTPPKTPPPHLKDEPSSPVSSSLFTKYSTAPLVISQETSPKSQGVQFTFEGDCLPAAPVRLPSSVSSRYKRATQYTLPPSSALPVEFNRKPKHSKSRKKDKDREKGGSDNGKREEYQPVGMAKWAAMLRLNPVYKRVTRTAKCLSTKDWNVSFILLRYAHAHGFIGNIFHHRSR